MNTEFLSKLTFENVSPCMVDEPDDNTTYVGYCLPNCEGTNDARWLIKRILQEGTVKKIFFANGSTLFNQKWDDRKNLLYKPTKNWDLEIFNRIASFIAIYGELYLSTTDKSAYATAKAAVLASNNGLYFPYNREKDVLVTAVDGECKYTYNGITYSLTVTADRINKFDTLFSDGENHLRLSAMNNSIERAKWNTFISTFNDFRTTPTNNTLNTALLKKDASTIYVPYSDTEIVEVSYDTGFACYCFSYNNNNYKITDNGIARIYTTGEIIDAFDTAFTGELRLSELTADNRSSWNTFITAFDNYRAETTSSIDSVEAIKLSETEIYVPFDDDTVVALSYDNEGGYYKFTSPDDDKNYKITNSGKEEIVEEEDDNNENDEQQQSE